MAVDFTNMDGYQFEDYISNLFRRLGFEVEATNYSNDGGVDLVATYKQPIFLGKYIIQCKNWIGPVGQPEVRDLYGVVMDQRANKGILITPSDYTQQAYDFANGKNIELINGNILQTLLATYFDDTYEKTIPNKTATFRNERYSYYQQIIAEEPNKVSNYLQMIELLREQLKEQDDKMCTSELLNDIIEWTDKLINRCFKTSTKEPDRNSAMMFKVEALIHVGQLAEATEMLLRYKKFWLFGFRCYSINALNYGIRVQWGGSLLAWNLYVAFKHINYMRGCKLIVSKLRDTDIFSGRITINNKQVDITTTMMENHFIYPNPGMRTIDNGKTKHLDVSVFYPKDIKNPSFFFDKFYCKSPEEYAQEIDAVLKLHGLL